MPVQSRFFIMIYLHMHGYLIKENLFLEVVQGDFDDTPSDYVSKVFSYFFLEVFQEDAEVTVVILELQPNHSAYVIYILLIKMDKFPLKQFVQSSKLEKPC